MRKEIRLRGTELRMLSISWATLRAWVVGRCWRGFVNELCSLVSRYKPGLRSGECVISQWAGGVVR